MSENWKLFIKKTLQLGKNSKFFFGQRGQMCFRHNKVTFYWNIVLLLTNLLIWHWCCLNQCNVTGKTKLLFFMHFLQATDHIFHHDKSYRMKVYTRIYLVSMFFRFVELCSTRNQWFAFRLFYFCLFIIQNIWKDTNMIKK